VGALNPILAGRVSAEAQAIHEAALIVDLHCDLLLTSGLLGWDWGRHHAENPLPYAPLFGHCDIPRLRAGNVGALGLGIVTNPFAGPWREAHGDLVFRRLGDKLTRHADALRLATTAQGIRSARRDGRVACFAGLEGAHALAGRLDALPRWQDQGLTYVGLAHFTQNEAVRPMVGLGACATSPLTDYGRELVRELDRRRILVDVAHLNRAGVEEVCRGATTPRICTHTACTAVHPSPRGIDDGQIRLIAETGGVIGVIFVTPFIGPGGAAQVARHLDHIKRLVGVQHCALGSDWEGFAVYPDDLRSADRLPLLTQALLDLGWTAEDIHMAYGESFLRVLAEVRGG
jgi:membrane dipeptidase